MLATAVANIAMQPFRRGAPRMYEPSWLSYLATASAVLDAWRYIGEAIAAVAITKETIVEADINRMAGEIALMSPEPDAAKAEAYFERALAVAFLGAACIREHGAARASGVRPAIS